MGYPVYMCAKQQRKNKKNLKQTVMSKYSVKIKNRNQVTQEMCFNINRKRLEPKSLINLQKKMPRVCVVVIKVKALLKKIMTFQKKF